MVSNSPFLQNNKVIGLKRGVVKDLKDPDRLNRVKVTLIDEDLEIPYGDVMATFAGEKSGTVFIPSKDEEVLVGFLDGQINNPVILGSLYNSKIKPPLAINDKNEIMLIQFPEGLKIEIRNEQNKQKITITTKKGHMVSLDDGSHEEVLLKEKQGKTLFKVDFKKGEILLKAKQKVSLLAGQDKLILENQKGVTIQSKAGKLNVNVNSAKLNAKTNLDLQANAKLAAKGNGSAEVTSSGQAVLKGSVTRIN